MSSSSSSSAPAAVVAKPINPYNHPLFCKGPMETMWFFALRVYGTALFQPGLYCALFKLGRVNIVDLASGKVLRKNVLPLDADIIFTKRPILVSGAHGSFRVEPPYTPPASANSDDWHPDTSKFVKFVEDIARACERISIGKPSGTEQALWSRSVNNDSKQPALRGGEGWIDYVESSARSLGCLLALFVPLGDSDALSDWTLTYFNMEAMVMLNALVGNIGAGVTLDHCVLGDYVDKVADMLCHDPHSISRLFAARHIDDSKADGQLRKVCASSNAKKIPQPDLEILAQCLSTSSIGPIDLHTGRQDKCEPSSVAQLRALLTCMGVVSSTDLRTKLIAKTLPHDKRAYKDFIAHAMFHVIVCALGNLDPKALLITRNSAGALLHDVYAPDYMHNLLTNIRKDRSGSTSDSVAWFLGFKGVVDHARFLVKRIEQSPLRTPVLAHDSELRTMLIRRVPRHPLMCYPADNKNGADWPVHQAKAASAAMPSADGDLEKLQVKRCLPSWLEPLGGEDVTAPPPPPPPYLAARREFLKVQTSGSLLPVPAVAARPAAPPDRVAVGSSSSVPVAPKVVYSILQVHNGATLIPPPGIKLVAGRAVLVGDVGGPATAPIDVVHPLAVDLPAAAVSKPAAIAAPKEPVVVIEPKPESPAAEPVSVASPPASHVEVIDKVNVDDNDSDSSTDTSVSCDIGTDSDESQTPAVVAMEVDAIPSPATPIVEHLDEPEYTFEPRLVDVTKTFKRSICECYEDASKEARKLCAEHIKLVTAEARLKVELPAALALYERLEAEYEQCKKDLATVKGRGYNVERERYAMFGTLLQLGVVVENPAETSRFGLPKGTPRTVFALVAKSQLDA